MGRWIFGLSIGALGAYVFWLGFIADPHPEEKPRRYSA
jgi:hypothetical protein